MVKNGSMVTLNKKEVENLINNECKKRLGISAKEFLQKREHGKLAKSTAVHDIEMLLKLA
ncbi:MAG: hypothetical protein FJ015_02715 [Chloroflexi bacterium]|nr:hypothetical protein [Chloroflexota bacterium]